MKAIISVIKDISFHLQSRDFVAGPARLHSTYLSPSLFLALCLSLWGLFCSFDTIVSLSLSLSHSLSLFLPLHLGFFGCMVHISLRPNHTLSPGFLCICSLYICVDINQCCVQCKYEGEYSLRSVDGPATIG